MTAQQLINQLQSLVKENPKAANMPVVTQQYDTVGNDDGTEPVYGVSEKLREVVIS